MLEAAHRAAKNSVADAQYTFTSDPGLVSSSAWERDFHSPIAYIDGSSLLHNGEPIEGARGATRLLGAGDAGAMISVQVSATQSGWSQATVTSDEVGPVASDAPTPPAPGDGQETDPGDPDHQTPGGQASGSPSSGKPSTDLADTGARGIVALVLAAAALACAGVTLGARRRSRS